MHKPLTVGSLFSGIGGFDLGFEQAGFQTVWQVEKEPFCIAVLKTKFPNAERYPDVLRCGKDRVHKLRAVDVVTAGFPCQDLSVAGKRAGLEGARSGLFWEVVRILGELRPAWFVLENVPGLFSSGEGRDFAIVLNALDELGYGLAWRVLNSQFFGVAQRRRRVFIVGRFGKPCPESVLFESESGGGNFAEGGEAGQDVAVPLTSGIGRTGRPSGRRLEDDFNLSVCGAIDAKANGRGYSIDEAAGGRLIAAQLSASAGHHGHSSPRGDGSDNIIVQQAISSKWAKGSSGPAGDEHHNLTVCIQDARGQRDKRKNGIGIQEGGPMYTLDGTSQHAVASTINSGGNAGVFRTEPGEHLVSAPANSDGVRDFAELPQGLDSARYRALGNAVTVSVAKWIAERIRVISTD